MMGTKTEHYQLNQWEPGDNFLRVDFNEDNAKIDAALASKYDLIFGSYQGNDAASQFISLGFTPKAVFVFSSSGQMATEDTVRYMGGFAVDSMDYPSGVIISENGFTVEYNRDRRLWQNSSSTHYYMAIR